MHRAKPGQLEQDGVGAPRQLERRRRVALDPLVAAVDVDRGLLGLGVDLDAHPLAALALRPGGRGSDQRQEHGSHEARRAHGWRVARGER